MLRVLPVLFCLISASSALAKDVYSTLQQKRSPHLRVGVSFRTVDVSFSTRSVSPLRLNDIGFQSFGPGDVGLFEGGSQPVAYLDGVVGPQSGPGFAEGTIQSVGQVSDSGRVALAQPVQRLQFSSFETNFASTLSPFGSQTSDAESAVGPFVELVFPLRDNGEKFLNAFIGYTQATASPGSVYQFSGLQTIRGTTTLFTYNYDFIDFVGAPGASYPLDVNDLIVFDAAAAIAGSSDLTGGVIDPTQSQQSASSTLGLFAVTKSDLDLVLHEIPIGLEVGRHIGKTKISLRGGPTINIANLSLTESTVWIAPGISAPIARQINRHSDTPVRIGAFLGINLTHPLNDDGSFYFTAHGSYRWVDSISIHAGGSTADVDLSSWEGGIGFGIVID